jgi:hypothetical protein
MMPESFPSLECRNRRLGRDREIGRRCAGVILVFFIRAKPILARFFNSICEVTREMIRMVIFKSCVFFLDEILEFQKAEQQRE